MDLKIIRNKDEEYIDKVFAGINKFNNLKHPEMEIFDLDKEEKYNKYVPFGFYALLDGEFAGGITMCKKMNWLDLDVLFVKEEYRKMKIGTALINEIIKYCEEDKIDGIHLYTLDFQAKGFYEKMGFTLVAEIKDWPVGITRYELIKYI